MNSSQTRRTARNNSQPWQERWFAGLTWKGLALVAVMCMLNSLFRIHGQDRLDLDWLVLFVQISLSSAIVLVPPTLAVVATYNLAPSEPWRRYASIVCAVLVSSAAAFALMAFLEWDGVSGLIQQDNSTLPRWISTVWPRYLLLSAVIATVFVFFRTRQESEAATQQAEIDRELFAQRMEEARLQMLQAQIEPHFLFNTLANVRRLYHADTQTGESMLDHLLRYLAVALPQMRVADTTIGREADLAEAYLNIQRIRMGKRLAFEIDIAESLRDTRIPPLMLLTLVENAIKHGLSPLPEGGLVSISAQAEGGKVRLRVADTGQGFTKSSGGGTGLANTRARLAAVHGPEASLTLALNTPRGVTATIVVPRATAERAAA